MVAQIAQHMQKQCLAGRAASHKETCCSHIPVNRSFMPQRHCSQPFRATHRKRIIANGLFGLGLPEVAVVAGIAVLVFGPSKLPELGKELGKTVKSFQTAAKEFETELKNAADETSDQLEEKADKLKDEAKKR